VYVNIMLFNKPWTDLIDHPPSQQLLSPLEQSWITSNTKHPSTEPSSRTLSPWIPTSGAAGMRIQAVDASFAGTAGWMAMAVGVVGMGWGVWAL
jgi:hypothetical protein